MPAGKKEMNIDKYGIALFACGAGSKMNQIVCFSRGSAVGLIGFYPKGQVPVSRMVQVDYFELNYEIDRYQGIIDVFRYEKPIYIYITWDAKNIITSGWLDTSLTSPEPVGEQEGQGAPYTPT
jgi:hypothetical protein